MPTVQEAAVGIRQTVTLTARMSHVTWHRKGDYFASVSSAGKFHLTQQAVQLCSYTTCRPKHRKHHSASQMAQ